MLRSKFRHEDHAAIVLCGGESRRMGQPKALLKLGERTFLECVVDTVSEVCGKVIVVAAPGQSLPAMPGHVLIVRDAVSFGGPLSGLTTGLAALPRQVEFAFVSGTDTPLLRPAVVAAILASACGHEIAIPFDGTHHQPLSAAYRVDFVSNRCRELLERNRQRMTDLLDDADCVEIGLESLRSIDPDLASFRNVNSLADYRALIEYLGMPVQG